MTKRDAKDKSIETEHADDTLEFPLRLSKLSLLNIRDDNAFLSPLAVEAALRALSLMPNNQRRKAFERNSPLFFYNYVILNPRTVNTLREGLHEESIQQWYTEFRIHPFDDNEERKHVLNEISKHFTEQTATPFTPLTKMLGQHLVEPMTLISCCTLHFRPEKSEYWQQLWSLKFHSNPHLSIETEFYFTKGFFRVALHDTFQKIEIPGEMFQGIPTKCIILLPRCSSDLVHLYANLKEYLDRPMSSAYLGVCIPKMAMDVEMNLLETLKLFCDLNNKETVDHLGEFTEPIQLSAARSLGHFALDMNSDKPEQPSASSSACVHSIDLSPVTPWVFLANRPFLFLITHGDDYLLIGQMLGPKLQSNTFLSKSR